MVDALLIISFLSARDVALLLTMLASSGSAIEHVSLAFRPDEVAYLAWQILQKPSLYHNRCLWVS